MDYALIFGHFGLPKLGIVGAAYASIVAEAVGLLGYFSVARYWPKVKKYSLFHFRHFRWGILGNVLKIGSPLMLQSWASFSSWLLFFIFIEKMGERELAVSSIIKNIYLLYLIPIWGFGSASNTLTSNLMGQGDADAVPEMLRKIVNVATCAVSIFTLVILIYPAPFIALFNPDPALVAATVAPLRVVAIALLLFPAATVLFNGISGAGDTKASMVIEILTICVYVGYIYLSSSVFHMGLTGVWVAEIWYMLFMGLGALYRLSSGKWRKAKV
jgi:Na+-driven multidrug efflux pump